MAIKDQVIKLVDGDQTQIRATVAQRGAKGAQTVEMVDSSGNQITSFPAGLSIPEHDDIVLSYDGGNNLTGVVYKKNSIVVATLNLTYSGSNLTRIVKS
jgi:hypothetical protein